MPTNLNALIRYKTINECLSTGRGYTKQELADRCTKALQYYRDREDKVATRTIEDDIKIMRGSELGLEAPIINKGGMYFYSDKTYHLARVLFTDEGIIRKTINTLIGMLEKAYDKDTEQLIEQLQGILARNKARGTYYYSRESGEENLSHGIPGLQQFTISDSTSKPGIRRKSRLPESVPASVTWGDLFRVVVRGR